MKKIFLIVALFVSCTTFAQMPGIPGYTNINAKYQWTAGIFNLGLHVPASNGFPSLSPGQWNGDGAVKMDTSSGKMYMYYNGSWIPFLDSIHFTGGGAPGNYGNIPLNRNNVFTTPGLDSLIYTTTNGLNIKNRITVLSGGFGTTTPAASAVLDASSTTKGFLAPRMTGAQQNAIVAPAIGLLIYNLDSNAYCFYNGAWLKMGSGAGGGGGGSTNVNIGSGYRLAVPGTNNIKTLFGSYALNIDSTTNANALTTKIDTTLIATRLYAQSLGGGGGGATPGGSNTQIQFNNSGTFGGSANFTYDGTNVSIGVNKWQVDMNGRLNKYDNTSATNGKLMIGETASGAFKLGNVTTPNSTLIIGYSSPNITADVDVTKFVQKTKLGRDFQNRNDSLFTTDWVNVLDYGAVGNGSTNNFTAFTAAVATGKNIYIPPGDYVCNATTALTGLVLQDNQKVFGAGKTSIVRTSVNGVLFATGNYNEFSGLRMVGSGKDVGGLPYQSLIFCYLNKGIDIHDCYFDSCSATGADADFGGAVCVNKTQNSAPYYLGVQISNCQFTLNGVGVYFARSGEYSQINNCNIVNGNIGILASGGNYSISNCHVDANSTNIKLKFFANSGHGTISGSTFNHGTSNSFDIDGITEGQVFTNCKFYYGNASISNSVGITFIGCDFSTSGLGYSITLTNNSNILIANSRWPIAPRTGYMAETVVSGEGLILVNNIDF